MSLKGKQLSLMAKIIALVFVIICFVVMVVTGVDIPIDDAIKVAIFAALVFSPVDISLWIENFQGNRHRKTIPDDGKSDEEVANESSSINIS